MLCGLDILIKVIGSDGAIHCYSKLRHLLHLLFHHISSKACFMEDVLLELYLFLSTGFCATYLDIVI